MKRKTYSAILSIGLILALTACSSSISVWSEGKTDEETDICGSEADSCQTRAVCGGRADDFLCEKGTGVLERDLLT